jgi:hypothetical protein
MKKIILTSLMISSVLISAGHKKCNSKSNISKLKSINNNKSAQITIPKMDCIIKGSKDIANNDNWDSGVIMFEKNGKNFFYKLKDVISVNSEKYEGISENAKKADYNTFGFNMPLLTGVFASSATINIFSRTDELSNFGFSTAGQLEETSEGTKLFAYPYANSLVKDNHLVCEKESFSEKSKGLKCKLLVSNCDTNYSFNKSTLKCEKTSAKPTTTSSEWLSSTAWSESTNGWSKTYKKATTCTNMKCSEIKSTYFNGQNSLGILTLSCKPGSDYGWTITSTNGESIVYESCTGTGESIDTSSGQCKGNIVSEGTCESGSTLNGTKCEKNIKNADYKYDASTKSFLASSTYKPCPVGYEYAVKKDRLTGKVLKALKSVCVEKI